MPPPAKALLPPQPVAAVTVTPEAGQARPLSRRAAERLVVPGGAEVVHAQFAVGNSAVAAVLSGPPGAPPSAGAGLPPGAGVGPLAPPRSVVPGPAAGVPPLPLVPLPAPTPTRPVVPAVPAPDGPGAVEPAPPAATPAPVPAPPAPPPGAAEPGGPEPGQPEPGQRAPGQPGPGRPESGQGEPERDRAAQAGRGATDGERRAGKERAEQLADVPERARPDREKAAEKAAAARRSPGADPKFQALKRDVARKKKAVASSHRPAKTEAVAAQAAAVPPPDDREARGKAAHAEEMNEARPKAFDKAAFIRAVEEAIARKAPQNLEQADQFGDSGKAEEVKGEVQGKVGEGKRESAEEIATTTATVPAPAPDSKTVVPMGGDKPPGAPAAPDPAQAVPDKLPPSATDLSAGPEQTDRMLDSVEKRPEDLTMAKTGETSFATAGQDVTALEKHSAAAPKALRADEAAAIRTGKAEAKQLGGGAMSDMAGSRAGTGRAVDAGKGGAKTRDEKRRAQVTALLQNVFDATKADVETILSELDGKVDRQFTDGERRARDAFTREHKAGMAAYKRARYSQWNGAWLWAKDKFLPLPEEANRIYERARDNYLAAMKRVIADVATTVETELKAAKTRIATGRAELKAAVAKLPADLRAIGQDAAAEFADRFTELADTVDAKGTSLVDTLADRYTEAVKSVDAEIAKEKEKNRGLIAKAVDAVKGVVDTIIQIKNMLLGVLRKAATAIRAILADPIGFLGNLVSAVGGGLKLFLKNIGRHLQAGVLGWLLGASARAGIQLPAKFDIRGIVLMIATLAGLHWGNLRARLTRKVPDRAVAAAETGVPMVAAAKRHGVAGLWNDLQTRVGDLRKDLIGKIIAYLTPTIIIAGITWILSLLNPASAFIRACKMIIDIIRFIITQGRQIIEFVNAVLDAVIAIAKGGGGGVPQLVERALARSIPVLIGALAAILGIGGIAAKVKQIVQSLARPVNRAIDFVIDKMAALVKRLWARLKAQADKRKRPKSKRPERDRAKDPREPRGHKKAPRKPRRSDKDPRERRRKDEAEKRRLLGHALDAAEDRLRPLHKKFIPEDGLGQRLASVRSRFRGVRLTLLPSRGIWRLVGEINPKEARNSDVGVLDGRTLRQLIQARQKANNQVSAAQKALRPKGPIERRAPEAVAGFRVEAEALKRTFDTLSAQLDQLREGSSVDVTPDELLDRLRDLESAGRQLVQRLEDVTTKPEEKVRLIRAAHRNISGRVERARAVSTSATVRRAVLDEPAYAGLAATINDKLQRLEEFLAGEGALPANLEQQPDGALTALLVEMRDGESQANSLSTDVERADRLADPRRASREYIDKIDRIARETSKDGRPGADVGDGSSEAALEEYEVVNGKPYKSPQGHWMKVRDSIVGLKDAVTSLERIAGQAMDATLGREIAEAVAKARGRIVKMESAFAKWEARSSSHPDKWHPNGESRVVPGWPASA